MSTRQTPLAAVSPGLVGYELFPARSTREAVKAILDAG